MRATARQPHTEPEDTSERLSERLTRAYVAHALAGLLPRPRRWLLKRAIECALALILYISAAPVSLVVALSLWIRFHGQPHATRRCVGRGGRVFTLWQLQMAPGVAPAGEATMRDAWLSASRVAKLPALRCALAGEMSLVGPAPWPVEAAGSWSAHALARLYVAPGILRLRPVGRLRQAQTLAEADLLYVTGGSLWMDMQQLLAALLLPQRRFMEVEPSVELAAPSEQRGITTS